MLHHLVPDEVAPGSLAREPRLLRAAHRARQLALARRSTRRCSPAPAGSTRRVELLRIAAAIDLDDLTGTTAGGLHLATMGGVWQALAFGFAGLRPRGDVLTVDPRLPDGWDELEIRLRFRGRRARVRIQRDRVSVEGDPQLHWEEVDHESPSST